MAKKKVDKKNGSSTVVWGEGVEKGDFLKVPRAMIRLHRYQDGLSALKSRHMMLLLVLASRKYQHKPTRAYWEELADDLGVSKETVRKWAYELRDQGLLRIKQVRGRDRENHHVGYKNDKNIFDITPFVKVVAKAHAEKKRQKAARHGKDDV